MKPITFKECNVTFAKDQPEYQPLPAYKTGTMHGEVISCWHLSFKERIKLLIHGNLWIAMMTFNQSLTPIYPTVDKAEIIQTVNDKWKSK
jgi:hypothetical protein